MQNINEFRKEIESIFKKLKFRYDLRGGFRLELEESVYEQNGLEFMLPSKVRFVGFDRVLEEIDLTREVSPSISLIESRLTSAVKRIDFYKWIYNFARSNDYEISFGRKIVYLFTEDRKEIEIRCIGPTLYEVLGRYILSPDATAVTYKIDSLLKFRLCDMMPSNALVKSAVETNITDAISLDELDKALKDTRRQLDYASERTLKIELVEKKGSDNADLS